MPLELTAADEYIQLNVLDRDDWQDADQQQKTSFLKVSETTLKRKFRKYDVPNTAIYHFAALLALIYNDTNKLQQHGVASFSITGVASFTFKENNVKTPGGIAPSEFITADVYELVGEANGVDLTTRRRVGRTVI
ncbi:hypothetical protein [Shouchella patagoniensis]|uniref:hypothetical protein n=1 Tax=Shouchella patagoniensis TaxID=228576 RepID=UPI00099581CF|nr:hypothetical protein [Shouchella patagoniensis]